jgi:hypothetical protein
MVSSAYKVPMLVLAAAVGGLASVIAPYVVVHGLEGQYSAPLFPLLRNAWELLDLLPTLVLLITLGAALGFLEPRAWPVLGISTALFFPMAATLEMLADPTSHKLWPIEFALYAALVGVPGAAGSFLGSLAGRMRTHAT